MCKPKGDIESGAGKAKAADVWHVMEPQAVMDTLKTSKKGLSSAQASENFKKYGPNQLTEKKKEDASRTYLESG
jgi:magnesium-transporting ATPase (P-type)